MYFSDPDTGCPGDCHGHGDCVQGQCLCYPGYRGWDCLESMYIPNTFLPSPYKV